MQAVLLAAGHSTRFEPLTSLPHKSMAKIMGKTILEHTIDSLKKAGVTTIILIVGENSVIPEYIKDKNISLPITIVTHTNAQGMGAALLDAKEYLEDAFFLLSAYHVDMHEFASDMLHVKQDERDVVLLGRKPQESHDYGVMEINGTEVTDVKEKPEKILDHQLQIVGIYLLNKQFLETLKSIPLEHYHFEKALDAYAKQKHLKFVKTAKETVSLKYAWHMLHIKNYLFQQMQNYTSSSAKVGKHAVLSGNIYIDDHAEIMDGAILKGPCYIGKNAVIGNEAILRNNTDIEANAVVGARIEIKNTILFEGVTTHSGFIGDSIIGERTKIGAYVCSANARLDRQSVQVIIKDEKVDSGLRHLGVLVGSNVHIGIRASIMPGVVIGDRSIIGPSTTVLKNVKPNTKYYTRFQEIVEAHEK